MVAAAALVLVLAGCSAEKPPVAVPPAAVPAASTDGASASTDAVADVPTKTATRPPAATTAAAWKAPPEPPRLDRFVAAVQQQLPALAVDRREEEVAALGELACSARAAGKHTATVVAEIENAGVTEADARRLLRIAEDSACRT